jgi:hypothetical protein
LNVFMCLRNRTLRMHQNMKYTIAANTMNGVKESAVSMDT